jgi:hypothetical protein
VVENDLTWSAHGTPAFQTPLDGYSQDDGSQHVNFLAGGHVHELYRSPDPAAQWVDNDLTALAKGTPAGLTNDDSGTLAGYSQDDNSQHVIFIDADGHVHELYRSTDPAAQWVDNDLTKLADGAPAPKALASLGTREATTASTSFSLTTAGTFTSCTGVRIRRPSGWIKT